MHDPTNQDPETTLFPSVPSTDGALATPPVSARAASGAAATRKAPKKPSAPQEGSQEPPVPKAGKGAKKPAKGASASATQEPAAESEGATTTPPSKPGKKPSKAKRAASPESAEPTAPAKAPKPSKKSAPSSMPRSKPAAPAPSKPWLAKVSNATLADAAKGFLEELEADGASESTVSGYRRELKIAMDHFGETKLLALIQPHEVEAYFECPAVMVARNGEPKAQPSYDRTRRVLRLALCWSVEHGLLETAPLPASN